MKKIIFLDFDGVINAFDTDDVSKRNLLTPRCVENLNLLMKLVPDAKIVISSTWRIARSLTKLKNILLGSGFKYHTAIIDTTPISDRKTRGQEIAEWLSDNPDVFSIAILDDESDMEPFLHRLVKTNPEKGLTVNDVAFAATLLKKPLTNP